VWNVLFEKGEDHPQSSSPRLSKAPIDKMNGCYTEEEGSPLRSDKLLDSVSFKKERRGEILLESGS